MSWLVCSLDAYAISTLASDGVVALANPPLQLGDSHARPNMENLAWMARCTAVCRIFTIVSLVVYSIMGHLCFPDGIDAGHRKLCSLDAPLPQFLPRFSSPAALSLIPWQMAKWQSW